MENYTWDPLAKVLDCDDLEVAAVILLGAATILFGAATILCGAHLKHIKKRMVRHLESKTIPGIRWRRSLSATILKSRRRFSSVRWWSSSVRRWSSIVFALTYFHGIITGSFLLRLNFFSQITELGTNERTNRTDLMKTQSPVKHNTVPIEFYPVYGYLLFLPATK